MRVVLSVAIATLATAAATFATTTLPASSASAPSYVALGDSYSSGALVPVQDPNALGCQRSDHNYPRLVAAARPWLALRDATCGGASTANMTQPEATTPGPDNPPQFSRLDSATKTVTLGIGYNDIGFIDIWVSCATANPTGTPCKDTWDPNGNDILSARIVATGPKIATALQGIHARSPGAKVFLVGYPAILPDSGTGCFPTMPIAPGDVPYLRAKEKQLNSMLARRAVANGAVFVDTYTPSIGHDACSLPTVRWIEPYAPANPSFPIHPNARGEAGMATLVLQAIARAG
jgi:hypothetical protein